MEALQMFKSIFRFIKYIISALLEAEPMELLEILLVVIAGCLVLYVLRILLYAFMTFVIVALS